MDLAGERIVAIPVVRVVAIPIVPSVPVAQRPVAAQADKDVLAMVVRIEVPVRVVSPVMVTDNAVVPGPDYSVAQSIVVVSKGMVVVMRVRDPVGPVVIEHSRGSCRHITVGVSRARPVRGSGAGSGVNHRYMLFRRGDFLSRYPCAGSPQDAAMMFSDAGRAPGRCPSLTQRARCCGLSASNISG